MKQEWWLTAAVSDDTLVAELLLRLKGSTYTTTTASEKNTLLLPAWGVRQPRSSGEKKKKKRDARRRSPTTPLSWSSAAAAAASPSDCDGDSSADHSRPSDLSRSKISGSIDSLTTSSKRHSRKKTFAELKEEEGSLLNERINLKKELATLRLTVVEQRSTNDCLKRRKLEFPLQYGKNTDNDRNTDENGRSKESAVMFVVPDLNMSPADEEEECEEGKVGMS